MPPIHLLTTSSPNFLISLSHTGHLSGKEKSFIEESYKVLQTMQNGQILGKNNFPKNKDPVSFKYFFTIPPCKVSKKLWSQSSETKDGQTSRHKIAGLVSPKKDTSVQGSSVAHSTCPMTVSAVVVETERYGARTLLVAHGRCNLLTQLHQKLISFILTVSDVE